MKVLALTSSVRETSRSTAMLRHFLANLKDRGVVADVTVHDLNASPPAHYSRDMLKAFNEPAGALDDKAREASDVSSRYIEELKNAELLLIAMPVYNWAIPSTLKCWIDHVVRLDHTFYTTPTGIEGLLGWGRDKAAKSYIGPKKVIYFVSSGLTPANHLTKYLSAVFKFIGLQNFSEVEAAYLNQDEMPAELLLKVEKEASLVAEGLVDPPTETATGCPSEACVEASTVGA